MTDLSKADLTPRIRILLCFVAGAIYPLGFAPLNLWPLALLSLTAACVLAGDRQVVFKAGFAFGLGLFVTGASWVFISIHRFGHAPWYLALLLTLLFVIYLALYPALALKLADRLQRWQQVSFPVALAFTWWMFEWLRGHMFSGFPWLSLGYAATDTLWAPWAPLIGESGIGACLALTSAWLADRLMRRPLCRGSTAVVVLFWSIGPLLALVSWSRPVGQPTAISLVQPNVDQNVKWDSDHLWRIIGQLQEETDSAPPGIVVWPEAAVPVFADRIKPWLAGWVETQKSQGKTIVTGIPVRVEDKYFNAVMNLSGNNATSSLYRKRRLVPFGEYVPFQDVLRGVIAFFNLPMSNFALGPQEQQPLTIAGLHVGVAICYEMAFPALVRQQAEQANWLLTVSNDTWFGDSWGPHQHLQMVRMRARETGLPVARATNNGITAVISERGEELARLPAFETGRLDTSLQPQVSSTPWLRFPWLCWLVPAGLVLLMRPWRWRRVV